VRSNDAAVFADLMADVAVKPATAPPDSAPAWPVVSGASLTTPRSTVLNAAIQAGFKRESF
jgi:hypothetical protein